MFIKSLTSQQPPLLLDAEIELRLDSELRDDIELAELASELKLDTELRDDTELAELDSELSVLLDSELRLLSDDIVVDDKLLRDDALSAD